MTDASDVKVVEMVLTGKINTELVSLLNQRNAHAVGLSGKDAGLLRARKLLGEGGRDLGRVGEVTQVNHELLEVLLAKGYVPVVSPVGLGEDGDGYNINADSAAAEIAIALRAEKLIYLTDVPGILENDELISEIGARELEEKIARGVVRGGMVAKAKSVLRAIAGGVQSVHIIDGRVPHSLVAELFTDRGVGTWVKRGLDGAGREAPRRSCEGRGDVERLPSPGRSSPAPPAHGKRASRPRSPPAPVTLGTRAATTGTRRMAPVDRRATALPRASRVGEQWTPRSAVGSQDRHVLSIPLTLSLTVTLPSEAFGSSSARSGQARRLLPGRLLAQGERRGRSAWRVLACGWWGTWDALADVIDRSAVPLRTPSGGATPRPRPRPVRRAFPSPSPPPSASPPLSPPDTAHHYAAAAAGSTSPPPPPVTFAVSSINVRSAGAFAHARCHFP